MGCVLPGSIPTRCTRSTKDGITAGDIAENLDLILDIKGVTVTDLGGPQATSEQV
jgi:hypothetical protein